ncbi:isoflavone reductase like protein pcber [Quercus suber]|uniref:Isoflavone reductase like protein pcber n=1 Tax=Quercus suber TaxID=58331 RepID=A0AAW0LFM2_QUESU
MTSGFESRRIGDMSRDGQPLLIYCVLGTLGGLASTPFNLVFGIFHSIFVKGDQTNFEIDPSFGVEASQL